VQASVFEKVESRLLEEFALHTTPDVAPHGTRRCAVIVLGADMGRNFII
jgi:hypothetical protein